MVLDLFKNPEKADNKISAVEHDAGKDDADERDLVVADPVPDGPVARGYHRRSLDAVPPQRRVRRDAAQRGREVVVEAERERGGPHGDEEHLGHGVQQLGRGRP